MKAFLLRGAAAVATAVALSFPSSASAQSPATRSLAGTVVQGDSAVGGVPVTLHRVRSSDSGPVGSSVTAPDGSFSFSLPPADTSGFEVFFVTAEHLAVRYFGPPIHGGSAPATYQVAVFDTASAIPGAIRVVRRDIVLIPETQGGWEANEIIRLNNSADRTLVSPDGMPVWETRLPAGVTDFEAGEGDLSASEIALMDDRVMLVSSLLPGDTVILLRYRVPLELEAAAIPIGSPTDTFNVFVGQPSPAVQVEGLQTTNVVEVQGQRFVQYGTTGIPEGGEVSFRWDAPASPPLPPHLAGTVAAILVLLAGTVVAMRKRAAGAGEGGTAAPSATG